MKLLFFLLASVLLPPISAAEGPPQTTWRKGSGRWTNAVRWSDGVPTVFLEATVCGNSSVVIPSGSFAVARLKVGTNRGDHSRIELNGGTLLIRQDSLIVGEYTGSDGTFVLNSGSLEDAMDVFVGGATGSTGRMNRSLLTIRGGTFVGLTLTIGEGLGSNATVSIEGSRANAISALDFVQLVPVADPSGTPGTATLAFTLDEHGVTPITISSRYSGLRLQHDASSHCRLHIALSSVPPRDDVILVSSRATTRGTFDGLPEGSEITADYAGHTYRWTLTYCGGSSGCDLVLHNPGVQSVTLGDFSPLSYTSHTDLFNLKATCPGRTSPWRSTGVWRGQITCERYKQPCWRDGTLPTGGRSCTSVTRVMCE